MGRTTDRKPTSKTSKNLPHGKDVFDLHCRRCPRLGEFLDECRAQYPDYHAHPVPAFGSAKPALLVVGLAPGKHGANRSGRPFTGDHAGIMLYASLHQLGFSNRATSVHASDGLKLWRCRITNAVKCLPPANKPTTAEINCCNDFLAAELRALQPNTVILALGTVAHRAILKALDLQPAAHWPFAHGQEYSLARGHTLLDSYHCSRYNTQTKRLTQDMFLAVLGRARAIIETT